MPRSSAIPRTACAIVVACLAASTVAARDYGQLGTTTPVIEPDLLAAIEARLLAAQASGKIAAMNKTLAARTEAKVKRPPPVEGLSPTTAVRSWTYDPTITVGSDIFDHRGNLIIPKGRKVNPLDTVSLRQSLVFIDADDAAQLRWAIKSTTVTNAKLILTGGSPFTVMKAEQRRVFFDQGGKLIAKFGIRHTPAVVEQAGHVLKVTEVVPPRAARREAAL
ncbi:type-F conjugative transfer system protein TraW (plasmid) [Polymorphobacter megasporae]|nr:type-F conjugative transfer system protein TraW [Polymorphobacter megasporae]